MFATTVARCGPIALGIRTAADVCGTDVEAGADVLVLFGIIAAIAHGASLGAVLAALTVWQWASLIHAGISTPRDVARIVRIWKDLDRRFPCDQHCQAFIVEHRFDMNGGPIGWGRSPYKYM